VGVVSCFEGAESGLRCNFRIEESEEEVVGPGCRESVLGRGKKSRPCFSCCILLEVVSSALAS